MNIGDYVKVIEQDIQGIIVEMWSNKAVIEDDASEFEFPENRLEFNLSDLELLL